MFERCNVLIALDPNGHRGRQKRERVGGGAHPFEILLTPPGGKREADALGGERKQRAEREEPS